MIDILNWIAEHWLLSLIFVIPLISAVRGIIAAFAVIIIAIAWRIRGK